MKYITLIMAVVFIAPLSACTQIVAGTALSYGYEFFKDPDVSIKEKSYAAADFMDQQISNFISKFETIKVIPLKDTDRPTLSADMAQLIPEQVGMRFMQLGYKVDVSAVSSMANESVTYGTRHKPGYILTGSYTKQFSEMDVSLRVVGADSGRLVGSFDYTTPITWEMRRQAKPEAQIFRVEE